MELEALRAMIPAIVYVLLQFLDLYWIFSIQLEYV